MPNTKKLISIVSPAYNEEHNISLMVNEVDTLFSTELAEYDYEYIFVDDGSSDTTWHCIELAAEKNPRVKGIRLSRNFGHQIALTAGLDQAKGDAVIYCDADLQHPPYVFKDLIGKWLEGNDVVHTVRVTTEDVSVIKKLFSNGFYAVINLFSDVRVEKGMADFKLLDRKVLAQLIKFREVNRFLRGIVPWLGYKQAQVQYTARKREFGKAGFSFGKSFELAKIGILSFSIKPLKFIGYFGVILTVLSALFISFSVLWYATHALWYFSPLITLVIFNAFLIGLVLICMGIMALYLSYIYNEVVDRPLYIVSDICNL